MSFLTNLFGHSQSPAPARTAVAMATAGALLASGSAAPAPNRFFDIRGDVSTQLAPWVLDAMERDGTLARWGYAPRTALFELREIIRFRSDIAGGVLVVPVGFISDLATIPQWAWSTLFAPDDPRIELGAWVHDLLCQRRGRVTLEDGRAIHLRSAQAATILAREAMLDLQANAFQCWAVEKAVRTGGPQWS